MPRRDWYVTLVDSNGAELSVGGGTQYADGATQANPTGTVALWLDTSNVLRAVSPSKPLPVNAMGVSASGATAVGVNPLLMGMNGAGALIRFLTEANAVAGTTGTGLLGVNSMVFDGTNYQKRTGDASGNAKIIGTKTNNNAAPGATNIGSLGALANAAAPSWTEGNQVSLSSDLAGNLRVSLQTTLNEANDSVTGHVGGFSKVATLTMTRPANTTPYTAGDEIADTAGTAAQRTFACARVNNGTGVITGASLIYSNNPVVTPVLELYLFDTDPTSAGDNAAFAPTDAQLATSIGVITFPTPKVGTTGNSGNLIYDSGPVSIEFAATGGTTSIFGLVVTRVGFTPIANSETLTIRVRTEMN